MKKQMKQIALPLFLGGLIACSPKTAVNETDLLGNWTEILPPSSNFVQGMTLAKEGKASSIGMATLQYERTIHVALSVPHSLRLRLQEYHSRFAWQRKRSYTDT